MANDLMAFNSNALTPEQVEQIRDEMDGIEIKYPRVKVPSGGSCAWEVPSADPEHPDVMTTIRGVILHSHDENVLYEEQDTSETNAPICHSNDGMTGIGTPGCRCEECPMNEFGTGRGGVGKACKNQKHVYIAMEGKMLPVLLVLPPTSRRPFIDYISALLSNAVVPSSVITEITLKKQTAKNGKDTYSVSVFRNAGRLDQASHDAILQQRKNLRAMLDANAESERREDAAAVAAQFNN